jgi:hypothetical protein
MMISGETKFGGLVATFFSKPQSLAIALQPTMVLDS